MEFVIKVGNRHYAEGTAEVTDLGALNAYITDKEGALVELVRRGLVKKVTLQVELISGEPA